MMTMPPVSVAFTMLPASISRVPARPFEGRADAAVVELDLRAVDRGLVGLDARLELLHQRPRGVQLLGADRSARSQAGKAVQVEARIVQQRLVPELVRLRLVRARPDTAPGSISTSTSPAWTSWPSEKLIFLIWPSTRDLTSTLFKACTVPSPVRKIGTSARRTSLAITGMAAAARGAAGAPGRKPQPRSNEIGQASAAEEQKRYDRPASHSVSELTLVGSRIGQQMGVTEASLLQTSTWHSAAQAPRPAPGNPALNRPH